MTTPTRITVDEIPLDGNLEAEKFKYFHSNMGDIFICRDLNNGNNCYLY